MTKTQVEAHLDPKSFQPFLLTTGDLAIVIHHPDEVSIEGSDLLRVRRPNAQVFQIPYSAITAIEPITE